MALPIAEFALNSERDVTWAAQRTRLFGSLAGIRQKERSALAKAVVQAARNAVRHGGGGMITFAVTEMDGRAAVEVVVRDHGPGIEDVPACLRQASDHGSGLHAGRQLVPHFDVDSNDEGGVTVRLRHDVPPDVKLGELPVAEWGTTLAMRTTQGALNRSQQRIGELGGRLEQLQQRGASLEEQLEQIKSLNETLELLALVASKTVNAVVIMDERGAIEWVNEGFERMTGFGASEVVGHRLADLLRVAEGEAAVDAELEQAIHSGHGVSLELKHVRKDGQTYWASLSLTPAFDEEGRAARWICIANDVSRRREAQDELRKARDLAEAANRAKSMFLANMSHEIRTPMNAVIGMTQLALETELTEEQREYLNTVEASAGTLLRLLNDLLDLSKIEAGKIEMDPIPFSLPDLLRQTLKPLRTQARQKGVELGWSIAPEVPDVLIGDETRLQQVLVNLVSNAIKFTAAGEIGVDVRSQWMADGEIGLIAAVRDTGIGISADKLQFIFDAFAQADPSTARHYGGTGLGLAICSHLVELMGGRIWAESHVAEGSCFFFSVRLGIGHSEPDELVTLLSAAPGRPLRVLVADDNPANRLLAERILQKRGHHVVQADDGRQALAAISREAFDVALIDVQMPQLDGFQTTALLRERERHSGTRLPVVAITASAMKGDRDRCLAAGMDAYLAKPISAGDLTSMVESLGRQAAPRRPILETPPKDFAAALARVENDIAILCEQMEMFLSDSPALMNQIREAAADGECERLQRAAHRLRGFASNFDAEQVVSAAARLEEMGREGRLHHSLEVCEEMEGGLAQLRRQLERFLEARPH